MIVNALTLNLTLWVHHELVQELSLRHDLYDTLSLFAIVRGPNTPCFFLRFEKTCFFLVAHALGSERFISVDDLVKGRAGFVEHAVDCVVQIVAEARECGATLEARFGEACALHIFFKVFSAVPARQNAPHGPQPRRVFLLVFHRGVEWVVEGGDVDDHPKRRAKYCGLHPITGLRRVGE